MTTEPDSDADTDPVSAIGAVCADAEAVRRRETARALRRLEARRELPERQREAVERMAEAIVAGLLAGPVERMAAGDDTTAERAIELFDVETRPTAGVPGTAANADAVGVSGDD